ncbi:MAG: class I SAM-dependent RNA methyltransferase [Lachnospira eligens]
MNKGSVYEGKVEKVDFPNKATVWVTDEDGQKEKAIVKNAIPGQTVRFCVNKKRKGHCEGRLMEVVEMSPLETNPACPHFGKCGGCTYQTVAYEEQLKIKSTQVEKLLSEVVSGEFPFEGIIGSPVTEEYRNKMEFSFGDEYKDGPLALGLHKRNSMYDIVPVTECKIIDEDYRKILTCVQDYAIEKELPFQHKLSHEGYLRHLLVRKSVKTGQILVDIVTTTQIEHDFTELVNRLTSIEYKGTLTGVLHTFNDSLADAVINEKTELLYGQDYIEEELLGLRFKITPFSFFQTNSLGAEVLYSKAREYVLSGGFGNVAGVDDTGAASAVGNSDAAVTAKAAGNVEVQGNAGSKPVIYDLYTGTGTIAQMLSPVASKVIGVEIVAEAVEAAKKNAAQNGLTNCEFIADDVLKALDNIEIKPDFIVLDPPRDGIHPKALEKIIDYGVDRMVYISCKPTSLARDLVTLQERGYKVEKCCCVDMFPNTGHVETVVLLSKGMVNSRKVKVDFSLEDMDLSEFKGKATYEQIKAYVLEQTGLKVSSLYIAQIKKKCGLDVGENFNLAKSENARQPQCTSEKEDAIMQAFRHFGII